MVVVMSRIRVTSNNAHAVAEQYRRRGRLAEGIMGCLGVQILRNDAQPDEFVVYSTWVDRDAYDRYRKHPAFRQAHERIKDIEGGVRVDASTRSLEVYEVLS